MESIKKAAVIIGIVFLIGAGVLAYNAQISTSHVPTPSQGQNGLFDWFGSFRPYGCAFILFVLACLSIWYGTSEEPAKES